jgi:hypothetical protein
MVRKTCKESLLRTGRYELAVGRPQRVSFLQGPSVAECCNLDAVATDPFILVSYQAPPRRRYPSGARFCLPRILRPRRWVRLDEHRARRRARPCSWLKGRCSFDVALKASTAQNRRAKGRLKRNRCLRSTLGTSRFSFGAHPYVGASLGLTTLTTLGVVLEFFFVEEVLLSSRENELGVAVNALQNPVS